MLLSMEVQRITDSVTISLQLFLSLLLILLQLPRSSTFSLIFIHSHHCVSLYLFPNLIPDLVPNLWFQCLLLFFCFLGSTLWRVGKRFLFSFYKLEVVSKVLIYWQKQKQNTYLFEEKKYLFNFETYSESMNLDKIFGISTLLERKKQKLNKLVLISVLIT